MQQSVPMRHFAFWVTNLAPLQHFVFYAADLPSCGTLPFIKQPVLFRSAHLSESDTTADKE
ncbi:MAG: hypothetical protein IJO54_02000 [Oscillospiraceae bacterium]|nr:hypothetical protein [Oscillospiraceae bacterium]